MFTPFWIMPSLALHIESQISLISSFTVCLAKRRSNLVGPNVVSGCGFQVGIFLLFIAIRR